MAEEARYLVLSADGADAVLFVANRARLESYLSDATAFTQEGGAEPVFMGAIPESGGFVHPGEWREEHALILEVKVVVPKPVTTKWALP